jgi:hypothetical protein
MRARTSTQTRGLPSARNQPQRPARLLYPRRAAPNGTPAALHACRASGPETWRESNSEMRVDFNVLQPARHNAHFFFQRFLKSILIEHAHGYHQCHDG